MGRPLRFTMSLAVFAVFFLAASCSSATSSDSATTTSSKGSNSVSTTAPVTAPVPTDPPGQRRYTLYWMRDCAPPEAATEIATCRIAVGESRLTDQPDVASAALQALMAGPSGVEKLNGESTNIRSITQLYEMTIENEIATVSFNRYFETPKTRPQVAQVVFTLTQFASIKKVRFLVDRNTNGATGVAPMNRDDFPELTPSVLIETPTLNSPTPPAFKLMGNAVSTSTGTFDYRVVDAGGAPITAGKVKVLASPGTRGPFLEPVKLAPGTTGGVTLITGPPESEQRTPLNINS